MNIQVSVNKVAIAASSVSITAPVFLFFRFIQLILIGSLHLTPTKWFILYDLLILIGNISLNLKSALNVNILLRI